MEWWSIGVLQRPERPTPDRAGHDVLCAQSPDQESGAPGAATLQYSAHDWQCTDKAPSHTGCETGRNPQPPQSLDSPVQKMFQKKPKLIPSGSPCLNAYGLI